jgi:hypothetical protein
VPRYDRHSVQFRWAGLPITRCCNDSVIGSGIWRKTAQSANHNGTPGAKSNLKHQPSFTFSLNGGWPSCAANEYQTMPGFVKFGWWDLIDNDVWLKPDQIVLVPKSMTAEGDLIIDFEGISTLWKTGNSAACGDAVKRCYYQSLGTRKGSFVMKQRPVQGGTCLSADTMCVGRFQNSSKHCTMKWSNLKSEQSRRFKRLKCESENVYRWQGGDD